MQIRFIEFILFRYEPLTFEKAARKGSEAAGSEFGRGRSSRLHSDK